MRVTGVVGIAASTSPNAASTAFRVRSSLAGLGEASGQANAWQHYKRAERLLEEFTAAACVAYWAACQGWDDPSQASYTPDDPVAGNALQITDEAGRTLSTIPLGSGVRRCMLRR